MRVLALTACLLVTGCGGSYTGAIGSYTCTNEQHLKAYTEARQAFEMSPVQGFAYWYGNSIKRNCEVLKDGDS